MRTKVASVVLLAAFAAGCHKNAESTRGTTTQAQTAADAGGATGTETATGSASGTGGEVAEAKSKEEACVDEWLQSKGLDQYGNKEGTMYMGGTPLFNERTGERTDRLVFVYQKHPEAKQKCSKPQ